MFYYLSFLSDKISLLNVFQYVTFRGMGAALTAFLLILAAGPLVIRILVRLKLGQPIRSSKDVGQQMADLHGSKKGTPTMGGVLILAAVTLSCILWARPNNEYLWATIGTMLAFGILGFLDDFIKITRKQSEGLTSRQKFTGQLLIAAAVGSFFILHPDSAKNACTIQIPFLKDAFPFLSNLGWWVLPFLMLVIVGSSNAVNLTDGLDGLAIGCTVSAASVYTVFAYLTSHVKAAEYLKLQHVAGTEELAIFCAALAGAGLGFLWYNCHPARVFMGDTGALAIGGALAVVSIAVNQEFLLVIVGGIFVMECTSVILQVASFKLTGKRIFAMSPIHHHFQLRGWTETTVVVRFWILSLVLALLGLATLKLR